MPQNNKGSILLYVLFLSSFLVLFFISFQGTLEKMLEGAKDTEANIQDMSSVQDALILLKNAPSATKFIDTNGHLSLVSLNQSGTIFSESLGGTDSREYWITSTGGATDIALNITQGGPVFYYLAAFNSGSEAASELLSSGVIATNATLVLSGSLNQHLLVIDPLGGSVHYTLDKGATTTIPASSAYRLVRDINGYLQDAGTYDMVNFIPESHTGIVYQKMGMYLKGQ